MALASGIHDTVVVVGVEAMTHTDPETTTKGLATASHWTTEGSQGATFVSLNGGLMDIYMKKYGIPHSSFAPFAITAHSNAMSSPNAVFHKPVNVTSFEAAPTIIPPVQLFDACPTCDGAAAVILTSDIEKARRPDGSLIRVAGSGSASDWLQITKRPDPLRLEGVVRSTDLALAHAGICRDEVDIFELHDAYSIMACLSLEASGFVEPGQGTAFAQDGCIALDGQLPIATFGGLKARGHPVGATGVYQVAEAFLQLSREAGSNQVEKAEVVMIQNIGGAGSSVFTHVLCRT